MPGQRGARTVIAAIAAASMVTTVTACGNERGKAAATPSPADAPSTSPADTAQSTTTVGGSAATIDELLAEQRPVVLAHTGGEDAFPGSTLFAFARSAEAGVDVLDLNVRLSADGVLIVQHDPTLERTTNGAGAVAEMTYAEIRQLDNAFWFTASCTCRGRADEDYVYRGVRTGQRPPPAGFTADDFAIPSLRDVVGRFPTALLGIEIEGGDDAVRTATELAEELRRLDRLEATVVSSFDDAALAEMKRLAPEVALSPGASATAAWVTSRTPLPAGYRILQVPPEFAGVAIVTTQFIDDSHRAGYLIWVWPNNRSLENAAAYDRFLAQGVDGLNINDPVEGVAALGRFLRGELPASQ
jgi:glycerophosphoryl diester phosphodiesterase